MVKAPRKPTWIVYIGSQCLLLVRPVAIPSAVQLVERSTLEQLTPSILTD